MSPLLHIRTAIRPPPALPSSLEVGTIVSGRDCPPRNCGRSWSCSWSPSAPPPPSAAAAALLRRDLLGPAVAPVGTIAPAAPAVAAEPGAAAGAVHRNDAVGQQPHAGRPDG